MNNFNLLRLIFSLSVVVSHSYPLSGVSTGDYLTRLTHGQFSFSFLGITGFFVISGYLVFQSLERSRSGIHYFRKRILRIFPALFAVLLATVVLGVFVYEGSFRSYLTNRSAWSYLPRNLSLLFPQGMIDGIFTHSIYNPTINGSLWSLLYEFLFYILLAPLLWFGRSARVVLITLILANLLVGSLFWLSEVPMTHSFFEPKLVLLYGPFFFLGALLALTRIERLKNRNVWSICLVLLLIVLTSLGFFDQFKVIIFAPIVILLGLSSIPPINLAIDKLGDISYGVYICSFPVQQTLMHFFNFQALELMAASIIISCLLGYVLWHGIEKQALRYK